MTDRSRWPGWVYSEGEEPDYRFSFANERTFLAWIRTSLALLAAAVAVDVVNLDLDEPLRVGLVIVLATLGLISAVAAWVRWALAERAIRRKAPLPALGFAVILVVGLVLISAVILVSGR
ncbi:DUF202 domain-containing protein [Nocardioides sp. GY 10113]|uniref:YidH family protein n=1 Tax=Nocardioides sp. GY 10113 TaxID=2569761 RepID=UPI0019813E4F|nr:DUF202 domain-containing protein [Nocardioides sp. GY 10113]